MLIYAETCLYTMMLVWLIEHIDGLAKKSVWLKAAITSVPMALLAGFRYFVGLDFGPYYRHYLSGNTEQFELLFAWVNRVCRSLGLDSIGFFTVCGFLFLIPLFLQIYRDSPDVALSVFLLFGCRYYFSYMTIMRQFIGCAFLTFSIRYIERRDLKKFLLFVLIATGFHTSCAVFVVAYWVCRLHLRPLTHGVVLLVISTVGRWFVAPLLKSVFTAGKYSGYLAEEREEIGWLMLAVQLAVLALGYVFYRNDRKYRIYCNLQALAAYVITLSGIVPLIGRIRHTFSLPSVIFIPYILQGIKTKSVRRAVTAILLLCFGYYGYRALANNLYATDPYRDAFTFGIRNSWFSYLK